MALPGFLSLLFLYPQLHRYAALALSIGLAIQLARFVGSHSGGFYLLVRRSLGWMMALVIGLAVALHAWQWRAERNALARILQGSPDVPNVLLIVLDTVRARSLSLYGHARPTTPQLERLASTGVRFERAITTAPWTTPAHASMFTGRFPHELSVDRSKLSADGLAPLDGTYPTLAEVLTANGYVTAGFVANIEYCGYETGLDRGFVHYEDYRVSPEEMILSSSLGRTIVNSLQLRRLIGYYDVPGRKTAATLNRDFLRWLSRVDERPFFAFLNYYDAHAPYLPPAPFGGQFERQAPRDYSLIVPSGVHQAKRHDMEAMSSEEIQAELIAYESCIAYLDHHLGLLFDELEARRILDNTLVIVTSDHGEQFGEHRLFDHGNSLYMPLLHVPLLVSLPSQVPAAVEVADPVSLRDLPATIVDLVGLNKENAFPGESLARHWKSTGLRSPGEHPVLSEATSLPRVPEWYPIAKGDMTSLMIGGHHYIRNGDGRDELYDIERDPVENDDISATEAGRQVLARIKRNLESVLARDQSLH
jgi:arylsulfatase A-like enzyme